MNSRKPNRIPEYDYSQYGVYFITICSKNMEQIFGRVIVGDGVLDVPTALSTYCKLSHIGEIVNKTINEIFEHYAHIELQKYVIMPNHMHLIIFVRETGGTSRTPSPTNHVIPSFVSTLKRFTNKNAVFPSGNAHSTTTLSEIKKIMTASGNTSKTIPHNGTSINSTTNSRGGACPSRKKHKLPSTRRGRRPRRPAKRHKLPPTRRGRRLGRPIFEAQHSSNN